MKPFWGCALLLAFLLADSDAQPENSGDLLTSTPLRKVYASKEGSVYVLGSEVAYRVTALLGQVADFHNIKDATPQALALLKDEIQLVICWASEAQSLSDEAIVNGASCKIYTEALVQQPTQEAVPGQPLAINTAVGAPRGYPYAVVTGPDEASYFVMSADSGEIANYFHREFRVSNGGTIRDESPDTSSRTDDRNPVRTYTTGRTLGNYTYFVANDQHTSVNRVRLIRVCDADVWDNWYEINLFCGTTGSLSAATNTLIGASFLTLQGGSTVLAWTVNDGTNARMCSVDLSEVNTKATRLYENCRTSTTSAPGFPWGSNDRTCGTSNSITECNLANPSGPRRLATGVSATDDRAPIQVTNYTMMFPSVPTAVYAFTVDGFYVVFGGFNNGIVNRFVLSSLNDRASPSVDGMWNITNSAVDFSRADGSDVIYALTTSAVYRLPIEECSSYTNCSSCVSDGGGLCGWCTVENKCSRSSACQNSSVSNRWVRDSGNCLVVMVTAVPGVPNDYSRTSTSIDITLTNLPAAIGDETFSCVFSGIGAGPLSSMGGSQYRCSLPSIPSFMKGGPDTILSQFSLRSSLHDIDFGIVVNATNFYDCEVPDKCSTCAGRYTCEWCTNDLTCKENTDTVCATSLLSQPMLCPRIDPYNSGDGKYYLHETTMSTVVQLVAANLESPQNLNSYYCTFTIPGRAPTTFPATRNSATQVSCPVPSGSATLPSGTPMVEVDIDVLYGRGPSTAYTIESDTKLVIYNCGLLASGECSACAELSPSLNCEFCLPTSMCFLQGGSCVEAPIMHRQFHLCGDPRINSISPITGPLQGGTYVNFTGELLGGLIITFGSQPCIIDDSLGTPGFLTVCRSPPSTNPGVVPIFISRRDFNESVGSFRYAAPEITGISPSRGPSAGGTVVYILGRDLDVGNKMETTATVSGRPCTGVSVMNSTHIRCTTSGSNDGSGGVAVVIDGTTIQSPNSVTFTHSTPSVTGIYDEDDDNDGTIIASGGVIITLTGTNLDVAVDIELSLIIGPRTVSTTDCTAMSPTLLVCQLPTFELQPGVQLDYALRLDGANLRRLSAVEPLTVVEDPSFENVGEYEYIINSGSSIFLMGENVNNVRVENYRVTIGNQMCSNVLTNNDSVLCIPPQTRPAGSTVITIYVGTSLQTEVGSLVYRDPPIDTTGAIAAGVVVGTFVIVVVIAVVLGLVLGTWFVKTRTGRQRLDKPMSRELEKTVMSDFESIHLRSQAQQRHSDLANLLRQNQNNDDENNEEDAFKSLDEHLTLFDQPEENLIPRVTYKAPKRAYANTLFENVDRNNTPQEEEDPAKLEEDNVGNDYHGNTNDNEDDVSDGNTGDDDEGDVDYGVMDDQEELKDDPHGDYSYGNEDDNVDYRMMDNQKESKDDHRGDYGYGNEDDVYDDYDDDDYDDFTTSI